MDKRVIFAVAGAGKTTYIVNKLDLDKKYLILTYTNGNFQNLKVEILKKFNYFPSNIDLCTYFSFLLSFCCKPLLGHKFKIRGINWDLSPPMSTKESDVKAYFFDKNDRLLHNRISKLLIYQNVVEELKHRLERYYDSIFIDEVQDFAGHDFDLLEKISIANFDLIYVGDFYQHTYDTSRDRNKNSSLHDDYDLYKKRFKKMGLGVDETSLIRSHRCSPTTCKFVTDNLGIQIFSHRNDETRIIEIKTQEQANIVLQDDNNVKLFLQKHYEYQCFSKNWGESKGENSYKDVCIVLGKDALKKYLNKELTTLPTITKNKLYVAITRAKNDVYLLPYKFTESIKKSKNSSTLKKTKTPKKAKSRN